MKTETLSQTNGLPWNADVLEAARQQGDPEGDELAALIFQKSLGLAPSGSRLGYNQLVDLADVLANDPELFLVSGSRLERCFGQFPEALRDYYKPMPAPSWVDENKLRLAAHLWRDNSLAMLGILYAASLPACYLIARGIPALYDTEKLREQKYIFQRIYETGLMLDAVMDPDGLRVVEDVPPDDPDHHRVVTALNALDPAGNWLARDGKVVRGADGTDGSEPLDPDQVNAKLAEIRAAEGAGRYLWGRGYIAAKKVRLLHASMRFMLLFPAALNEGGTTRLPATLSERIRQRREPWAVGQMGQPVNQEDLAYTLLTFAYLLPKGLEHWGCQLSLEQKEAFLHLWRVVGHVMGLRDDLMTEDWAEAEKLYGLILARQGKGSAAGVALTEAVAEFLKSYLPSLGGLREYLPYTLIADQLGGRAQELVEPANWARVTSVYGRVLTWSTRGGLVVFYWLYGWLERCRLTDGFMGNLIHRTAEELVQSWRDEYQRQPFYVPTDLTTWELKRGVDAGFKAKLTGWRQRVFMNTAAAVAFIGIGMVLLMAAILPAVFLNWGPVLFWPAQGWARCWPGFGGW